MIAASTKGNRDGEVHRSRGTQRREDRGEGFGDQLDIQDEQGCHPGFRLPRQRMQKEEMEVLFIFFQEMGVDHIFHEMLGRYL